MRIYHYIFALYAVACMMTAPMPLHAEEENTGGAERGRTEPEIIAKAVLVQSRDSLSVAQMAAMLGKTVHHDRENDVVLVLENGEVVRRIEAEARWVRVIVNEFTGDFLLARIPEQGEKTPVMIFDRRGELKLEVEVDLGSSIRERIVGTLDNAVITRAYAFGPPGTKYKIFRYDHEGKQTLVEEPNKTLATVSVHGENRILADEGVPLRKTVRKYNSKGIILYEYSFPGSYNQYFISQDGRNMLTSYQPEGERHKRNFKLHIEGREAAEWQAGIPRSPVIFVDEEETVVYREWPQRRYPTAYTYDGRRRWSVRNEALSIAVHKIGHRSVVSSYELKDGLPRVAHYSFEDGTILGVTDLGGHVDLKGAALERVPDRFYADEAGNLIIPIADTYVTIRLNRRDQ